MATTGARGTVQQGTRRRGLGDFRLRAVGTRSFWACWILLAAATLALSVAAATESYFAFDVDLARSLQSVRLPGFSGMMRLENAVGSPLPAVAIIAATALLVLGLHRLRLAIVFAGVNALRGVGSVVKWLVDRPRPPAALVRVTEHASGKSFPSGHVFSAVLLYGTVAVLVELTPLPVWARRLVQALCIGVILLMGPARVYVGAHWPSGVVGGYLWGSLLLMLGVAVAHHTGWLPHRPRPTALAAKQDIMERPV